MSCLTLSLEEREALERWARRPKTAQALARRAEVVLGPRTSAFIWTKSADEIIATVRSILYANL